MQRMTEQQLLGYLVRASWVKRYHNRPLHQQDTVGRHSFMVVWLVWYLTDGSPSSTLLMAALHHDVPEAIVSDLSAPIKRIINTEAPGVLDRLESQIRDASGVPDYCGELDQHDQLIIKLADRLDGAMFTAHEVFGMGNHALLGVYQRYCEYLREMLNTNPAMTAALQGRVENIMKIIDRMFLTSEDTEYVVFG